MVLLWLRVAAVLYAAASIAVFPSVSDAHPRWRKICVHLGGMAFFFHLVSVIEMLLAAHRWVPVGVREVESLLGLAVATIFFVVWWLFDAVSLGLFAFPATFLLVFVPSLGADRYIFPSQGVRVGWLIAHIAALLLSYAALGFSLLASLLYLIEERNLKSKSHAKKRFLGGAWDGLPPLDTLERIARRTLEFGFPVMTIGLVIGSALAQETPLGAAYFLDPKILVAFASWGIYALLLLVRRSAGLRGRKAAYLTGAVVLVMVAVWAANLFSRVHGFGAE